MLFKIFKKNETTLHKSKSFWSTFKNAYLKRKDLINLIDNRSKITYFGGFA